MRYLNKKYFYEANAASFGKKDAGKSSENCSCYSWAQWCMPMITATWEVQAGMIACIQKLQACLRKENKRRVRGEESCSCSFR